MKKRLLIVVVALVAMCISSAALAGEGVEPRHRRLGEGPQFGQNREGQQGPVGPMHRRPFGRFLHGRMLIGRRFLGCKEGQALRDDLREQWKKSKDELQEERKGLREKFLGDLREGKKPREILPGYHEQFRTLIEKAITARIEFLQKLLEEVRKNAGRPLEKIREQLRERPAPLKPHRGDAKPQQD